MDPRFPLVQRRILSCLHLTSSICTGFRSRNGRCRWLITRKIFPLKYRSSTGSLWAIGTDELIVHDESPKWSKYVFKSSTIWSKNKGSINSKFTSSKTIHRMSRDGIREWYTWNSDTKSTLMYPRILFTESNNKTAQPRTNKLLRNDLFSRETWCISFSLSVWSF